jgi:HEAT repeat protein
MMGVSIAAAAEKPAVPDLTRGGQPDKTHDWTLGPTGARGWIWGWRGHTTDARQILVTDVAADSPADGILRKGDVIVGVDGRPFDGDARILFARSITAAETEKGGGVLRLLRWRDGRADPVELKLHVMGTYAATAPYGCGKSKRILDLGLRAIASRGLEKVSIPNDLNALALLASGRAEFRPLLDAYARKVAEIRRQALVTWHYAYANLFLAEYTLATGDAEAAAALRRVSLEIARGQGGIGTWGHDFARADGILNGYGAMNQPGLALTLSMVLARDAGMNEPDMLVAIRRSAGFLRWYVNKGAIPYGDHEPWPEHEDNGTCSSAAVLFDLLGDAEAASFFSRMATAAHGERESGHTGNFFNLLWALPGVARGGPEATGAYLAETSWYYDLARAWDGSFTYQGIPADWGGHSYGGWDSTGAYLLGYALPLKKLLLTGRKAGATPVLSGEAAAATIAAGRDYTFWTQETAYDGRATDALLAGLAGWSPAVRTRSAAALGKRDGEFVPRLLAMLDGADRDARYGACEALAALGPRADAAAPRLLAALADPDPWIRTLACGALVRFGPAARRSAVPDLLRLAAKDDPSDPRGMVQRAAATALFSPRPGRREPKSLLADSLEGVDRALLYPAVETLLRNQDGATRGQLRPVYGKLDDRDLATLMPAIVEAVRKPSPSGEMFADGVRLAGLDLLSRLRIREGMDLCVDLIEPERWGLKNRLPRCLDYLVRYGDRARPLEPRLREIRSAMIRKDPRKGEKSEHVVALDKALARLASAPASATPVPLDTYLRTRR